MPRSPVRRWPLILLLAVICASGLSDNPAFGNTTPAAAEQLQPQASEFTPLKLPPSCAGWQTFLPQVQLSASTPALAGEPARPAATDLNLAVRHIEVTQAIQCETRMILLVAQR